LHISAVFESITDMKDAAFKSNKGKIEASLRPRPTILHYSYAYSRVAEDQLSKKQAGRKHKSQLILDQVNQHNSHEKVRASRIKTEEIAALKNVAETSLEFQRRMKIIWHLQAPPYTSVPNCLLASRFLSPTCEPTVRKEENPVWYSFQEWTSAKADSWLLRTDGRFRAQVAEVTAKVKKPNLQKQAALCRDTGNEALVWLMSCTKVWVWPEAQKHNSQQRLKELEQAWQRGALDETLKHHCTSMRKDFKAGDISWVGAPVDGVGAFGSEFVDHVGQQQIELTDAQKRSLESQSQEWAKTLKIEAVRHKLWLSEVEVWDTRSEAVMQTYRNNRALIKDARGKELLDEMYTANGFTEDVPGVKASKKDSQSGMKATATYVAQRLTKVADKNPARPPLKS
jgi:hypothetical protein